MNSVFASNLVKIVPSNAGQINELKSLNYHLEKCAMIDVALKNKILVAGFSNTIRGKLLIWNLDDDSHHLVETDLPSLWSVDISSNGKLIAAGGSAGMIGIWDTETAEQVVLLLSETRPKNSVFGLAFSTDDKSLISSDRNCNIRLWNLENFEQVRFGDDFSVWPNLIVNPDGRYFGLRGSFYNREQDIYWSAIRIWDLHLRNTVTDLKLENSEYVHKVVFGPHTDCLTIVRKSQLIRDKVKRMSIEIVNWRTGLQVASFDDELEAPSYLCDVIYNPDGTLLVCAIESGYFIWDITTVSKLKAVRNMDTHHLAFSLDGKLLASSSLRGDIRLWGITENNQAD